MLSIEFVNQRQSTCLRCEGRFRVVLPTKGDQESLAAVVARSRIEFMSALRESTGCGLVDAKAMAEHVVSKLGFCHRCGREIRDRLLVDCPRCRASNPLHHGLIKCDECDFPLDQFRVLHLAVHGFARGSTPSSRSLDHPLLFPLRAVQN